MAIVRTIKSPEWILILCSRFTLSISVIALFFRKAQLSNVLIKERNKSKLLYQVMVKVKWWSIINAPYNRRLKENAKIQSNLYGNKLSYSLVYQQQTYCKKKLQKFRYRKMHEIQSSLTWLFGSTYIHFYMYTISIHLIMSSHFFSSNSTKFS